MATRHITVSGEPGSGTSTVADLLAKRCSMRLFSTGAIHRQIAHERGETALETNITAETDDSIDRLIDSRSVELGRGTDPTVFDSRMAWHFVPHAFKVHLLVDATAAAARIADRATSVESYGSIEEAALLAHERADRERSRFSSKYGVDIGLLNNYDLVIDTTELSAIEVADIVIDQLTATQSDKRPMLVLSPIRIEPLGGAALTALAVSSSEPVLEPVERRIGVRYSPPVFYCDDLDDLIALSRAIKHGRRIIPAFLVQQEPSSIAATSEQVSLSSRVDPHVAARWRSAHPL